MISNNDSNSIDKLLAIGFPKIFGATKNNTNTWICINCNGSAFCISNYNNVVCRGCGCIVEKNYTYDDSVNMAYPQKTSGYIKNNGKRRRGREFISKTRLKCLERKFHITSTTFERSAPYKRTNHYNQILLAWARECKPIQKDILDIVFPITLAYCGSKTEVSTLSHFDFRQILAITPIPPHIQHKYRSKIAPHKLLTNLNQRKQFALRWWLFRDDAMERLGKKHLISIPPHALVSTLRHMYIRFAFAFTTTRHVCKCCGGRCHKRGKCRKGFVNLYYFTQLLLKFIHQEEYVKWAPDFQTRLKNKNPAIDIFNRSLSVLRCNKFTSAIDMLQETEAWRDCWGVSEKIGRAHV